MKSGTGTPNIGDRNGSSTEESGGTLRAGTNHIGPGSRESARISKINKSILELSPAVTIAGTYLGMGLASQIGFFSSANQYQHHSMVGIAAVAGAIKTGAPPKALPENQSLNKDPEEDLEEDLEHALVLAENAMRNADTKSDR